LQNHFCINSSGWMGNLSAIRIRTCRICITRTGTVNRVSVQ
jgi:hypothetical protein